MRIRTACFLIPWLAGLGAARTVAASSWALASCDPSGEARWRAVAESIRTARPGSQVYTPKPYPTTAAEVVADYLYRFKSIHAASNGSLAPLAVPNDAKVVSAIASGKVSYNVVRVENWTGMRCAWQHDEAYLFVVQVIDISTGKEISRAVVAASGLFVSSINLPVSNLVEPSANRILPTPKIAMREVDRELGLDGIDPQYIATFGTISCDMAFPCLAFHQGSLSYILYRGELWEVSVRGPHLTRGREVGTLDKNQVEIDKLTQNERLVSLGGVHWTVARKVGAAQVRHGISAFP